MSLREPPWATEKVLLSPPDPDWAALGERLAKELESRLKPWLVEGPHHVGSTAVPSLVSKPIIDLMAAITTLDSTDEIEEILRDKNWFLVPQHLDRRPWRSFLIKVEKEKRVAHLHLMEPDTPRWNEQLIFRDVLREDPSTRNRYAQLKKELSHIHRGDREAYTNAKSDFIRNVLRGRYHAPFEVGKSP